MFYSIVKLNMFSLFQLFIVHDGKFFKLWYLDNFFMSCIFFIVFSIHCIIINVFGNDGFIARICTIY